MNINNFQLPTEFDLLGSREAAAAGVPDPRTLAQYAKAFFGELNQSPFNETVPAFGVPAMPQQSIVPVALPAQPPFTGVGNNPTQATTLAQTVSQQINSPITETIFPSFSTMEGFTPSHPPIPVVPVAGIPTDFGASPFGFLGSIRSLEVPIEQNIPAHPGFAPADLGKLPAHPLPSVNQPAVLGEVPKTGDRGRSAAFSFLDTARPAFQHETDYQTVASQANNHGVAPELFDVNSIRRDFPILQEKVNGRPLIWLDNAATTQKPKQVIDRLVYFYEHENSNVHRAAHDLAARATDAYDGAREKVRGFLNASSSKEIIFVRGATEAINLVANTWGKQNIKEGDEIIVSHLEHHANIVPWQMLCAEKGATLKVIPVDNDGQILLDEYEKLLGSKTKLVAFTQVSNALGTVTPVEAITQAAHRHGAKVLVDGAQAVSHTQVDVQQYDCDFYVFSGHKVFGPTGIGVVFGKLPILENTQPLQGGGNMIADVTFEKTVYQPAPFKFEAGTGNIADAVGLGAAIDYVTKIGMHNINRYEHALLDYATQALLTIPGLRLIGTAKEKTSVASFVLDGFTTDEVGKALNKEGIALRTGHHCAQPILRRMGVESTVRPSLAFYNTCEEIDTLIAALWNLKKGRVASVV